MLLENAREMTRRYLFIVPIVSWRITIRNFRHVKLINVNISYKIALIVCTSCSSSFSICEWHVENFFFFRVEEAM